MNTLHFNIILWKVFLESFGSKHLYDIGQKNQLAIFSLLASTTIWCRIDIESKKDFTVPKGDSSHTFGKSSLYFLIILFDALSNLFFIITHKFSTGLRSWDEVGHFRKFIPLSSSCFVVYVKVRFLTLSCCIKKQSVLCVFY